MGQNERTKGAAAAGSNDNQKQEQNLGCPRAIVELVQNKQTNKSNALNRRNFHKMLLKCNYGIGYNLSS